MSLDIFLDKANYLSTADGTNSCDEKICQSLLIHSVLDTICKKIIKLWPCSAIYSYFKNHYHILTWASQVLTWQELLLTQMKDGEGTTALVDRVLTKVRSYKNTNSKLNEDHIVGLLLQQETTSQPTINALLQNKLQAIITTYGQKLNFSKRVSAPEACTRQVTAQQAIEATKTDLNAINFQ
ncbi:hypothetical protein O181_063676 [Austropuccinia psidii MF-1]|uniref:Uncharacterized protein n=1 Tax=Austropuccinia psidii MF-1 TaxID=1389203 RepID=A0A9Q3HZL6_9BASI|nr:hypothetical protein [Austropuccinia psidii MF-1]